MFYSLKYISFKTQDVGCEKKLFITISLRNGHLREKGCRTLCWMICLCHLSPVVWTKSAILILLVARICMWNMQWKPEEVYLHVKHGVKARGSLCACETWSERLRKFMRKWNMVWKTEEVYLQVKHAVKAWGSLSARETCCKKQRKFIWKWNSLWKPEHVCLEVWTRQKQRHCKHSSCSGL